MLGSAWSYDKPREAVTLGSGGFHGRILVAWMRVFANARGYCDSGWTTVADYTVGRVDIAALAMARAKPRKLERAWTSLPVGGSSESTQLPIRPPGGSSRSDRRNHGTDAGLPDRIDMACPVNKARSSFT
ncbi:hypothetical protein NUW54_g404 [Trametes sanguinea]|uniref:Uncharacterized protein n=1 Tax=Trametes sanguinea TaxID=158606 RepID=A0ACC1QCF6_9APHY|nr:hypothetical protein NUW54_g404 [Trametes sanguinea]